MEVANENKKSFTNDIQYHLESIQTSIYQLQIYNSKNKPLVRALESFRKKLSLIMQLASIEPKYYLNSIYGKMVDLYNSDNQLEGFTIQIPFVENANPERIGLIKAPVYSNLKNDNDGLY